MMMQDHRDEGSPAPEAERETVNWEDIAKDFECEVQDLQQWLDEAYAENERLKAQLSEAQSGDEALREALIALRRREHPEPCWCEKAVDHPPSRNHSRGCELARRALT